jgi:uncharacterized protein YbbC (DUF1343 family)
MQRVVTGLEVLIEKPELVGGRRWALLANQSSVTGGLDPARQALAAAGIGSLVRLFAPEHGIDGIAQDHEAVSDRVDGLTGAEVRSLYGHTAETLAPAVDDLEGIDVLIVDLPDIGSRYYTFAATMDFVMAACERASIEVMVLDRPNPIGGTVREGGSVQAGFESFVSQLPTPVRHGLTLCELALLLQRRRYPDLELTLVPCRGWLRNRWGDETGVPWVPPSPNMPDLETAALYPGLCLIEATTLSEGRGTTRPFRLIGAPWVDSQRLVRSLRDQILPGIGFRAARFRPEFGKYSGEVCDGVELHLLDRRVVEPVALGLRILEAFRGLDPERFEWRSDPYEFVTSFPAIDLLTGSSRARDVLESGGDLGPLLEAWRTEVIDFERSLDGLLLYHDSD